MTSDLILFVLYWPIYFMPFLKCTVFMKRVTFLCFIFFLSFFQIAFTNTAKQKNGSQTEYRFTAVVDTTW